MSKAALNMAIAKFDIQYAKEGILFAAVCPGAVATEFNVNSEGKDLYFCVYCPPFFSFLDLQACPGHPALPLAMERIGAMIQGFGFTNLFTADEAAKTVLENTRTATIEKNGGALTGHDGEVLRV